MILAAVLAATLAQQPLPPNHPPVDGSAPVTRAPPIGQGSAPGPVDPNAALPPNHPPMTGTAQPKAGPVDPNASLPPNHPPMDGSGRAAPGSNEPLPPGHPATQGGKAPTAEELIRRLDSTEGLKDKDKSFEVAVAMGKLYYSAGRFADAAHFFGQAWDKAKPIRDAFAKNGGEAALSKAPVGVCADSGMALDALAAKLPKLEAGPRAACLRETIDAVGELAEMQGEAYFLSGDPKQALKTLDGVLKELPGRAEARFARASILIESQGDDVAALKRAEDDLVTLVKQSPNAPRAARAKDLLHRLETLIPAGGVSKLAASRAAERKAHPPEVSAAPPAMAAGPMQGGPMQGNPQQGGPGLAPLSQETMQAFQNVERTPELEARLGKLLDEGETALAKGSFQAALDSYKQVMPLDPNNGRVRAGLAWAMVGLQKPTADRIWSVAVDSDPAAVEMLGHALEAHGDKNGAQAVWKKLAESAPEYAQRTGLASRLK